MRLVEQWTNTNQQLPFTASTSKRRLFKKGIPVIRQGQVNQGTVSMIQNYSKQRLQHMKSLMNGESRYF